MLIRCLVPAAAVFLFICDGTHCAVAIERTPAAVRPAEGRYLNSLEEAEKNYARDIQAARKKYIEEIRAAITDAMKKSDLNGANALNAVKERLEKAPVEAVPKQISKPIAVRKAFGIALPGWLPSKVSPGANISDKHWGGMVVGAKWIEWTTTVPAGGGWYLNALLACKQGEPRPCTLTIDGVEQEGDVLDGTTAGYHLRSAKWFQYGPYQIERGLATIRISTKEGGETPHMRGIYLTRDPEWTSDDDTVLERVKK